MDSKLNKLLQKLPNGAVATQSWLEGLGVYRQLTKRYVDQGWLERFGHGAFIRTGDTVGWLGGVFAMQSQLGLPVHIGGDTALALKGLGHFLQMGGEQTVHLFGAPGTHLPGWFGKGAWGLDVDFHCPRLFALTVPAGWTELPHERFTMKVSAPERAILETIYLANDNAALIHAHTLMEGLATLRPDVVQELLEHCRSIRVKRTFLWSADSAGHAWFRKLDLSKVELGAGKRQVFIGGEYDATYRITVPPREEGLPDV